MTTVAAGTLKAAKSASLVVHMTGTTVFTLGMSTAAPRHGRQITVTLFTVANGRRATTVGPDRRCRDRRSSGIGQTGHSTERGSNSVVA